MIERREVTYVRLTYACDFCRMTSPGVRTCELCQRQACSSHGIFDTSESGFFPGWHCAECWSTGEPYRDAITGARRVYEEIETRHLRLWREACQQHN